MSERVEAPRTFGGRTQQRIGFATLAAALVAGLFFGSAVGSATMRPTGDPGGAAATGSPDPAGDPGGSPSAVPSASPEPQVAFIEDADVVASWPTPILRAIEDLSSADIRSAQLLPPSAGGRDWQLILTLGSEPTQRFARVFEALADSLAGLGFGEIRISHSSEGGDYQLHGAGVYAYVSGRFWDRSGGIVVVFDVRSLAGRGFTSVHSPWIDTVMDSSVSDCLARDSVEPWNAGQFARPEGAAVVAATMDTAPIRPLLTALRDGLRAALVGRPADWGLCGTPNQYLDGTLALRADGLYLIASYDSDAAGWNETAGTVVRVVLDALRAQGLSGRVSGIDAGFDIAVGDHPAIRIRLMQRPAAIDSSGWVLLVYAPIDALGG